MLDLSTSLAKSCVIRVTILTALFGALLLTLLVGALHFARALPSGLPLHLLFYVGAGAVWLGATFVILRLPPARGQLVVMVLVGLCARIPAWLSPPRHSDDVYRYLWDGRVQRAGQNPYRFAADAPELAPLRDDNWQHINNRELPTIYPPLLQLAFRATPSLVTWKLIVALADAAVAILLYFWLADRRRLVFWLWSPLVIVELSCNAHADVLGVALFVGGLYAWQRARPAVAGALVAAAAGTKLLPVLVLFSMPRRKTLIAALVTACLLLVPFASARSGIAGSFGEYGRRWRINDGLFSFVHAGAEAIIARSRYNKRYEMADSPRLVRAITGRDRNELYPDEATNLLARAVTFALFAAVVTWALLRGARPLSLAEVLLGSFALLTPALHPWYVVWLVPVAALGGSYAWLVLAALAPLGYRPLDGWLVEHVWRDPVWTRLIEHGLTILVLAVDRLRPSGIIEARKHV
jgi:hypothetical protein